MKVETIKVQTDNEDGYKVINKEDFVLEESRPKDLKELLIMQSSGSEESNYGSISSRSSDSSISLLCDEVLEYL